MRVIIKVGKVALLVLLVYLFRNVLPGWTVYGKYVNTNYENSSVAEIPSRQDTLVLFSDMTFSSSYYGKGIYDLKYDLGGTKITWVYDNKRAIHISQVRRSWLGNIRIDLVSEINQYYSKYD